MANVTIAILKPGERRKSDTHPVTHHTPAEPRLEESVAVAADRRRKKYHPPRPGHPLPAPGSPPPDHRKKKHPKLSELQRFLWAEGEQESGNNYSAENPNSGALGRWQVMPSNLPVWLPESGYHNMSPSAFLNNHKAQNAVAYHILGGYFHKYGPAGAAAMWYSGQPDPSKTYGNPPVYVYVDDVLRLMDDPNAAPVAESGTSVLLPWQLPHVSKNESWSTQVRNSAMQMDRAAKAATAHATLIHDTYHRPEVRRHGH